MEFIFDTNRSAMRRNTSHNSGLYVRALMLGVAAGISFSAHAQSTTATIHGG